MALVSFLMLHRHAKRALAFGSLRRIVSRPVSRGNRMHLHYRHFSAATLSANDDTQADEGHNVSPATYLAGDLFENKFQVTSPYSPTGDQPQAIELLVKQVSRGDKFSILKGITGTGKTNVMAHTIARLNKKPWFYVTTKLSRRSWHVNSEVAYETIMSSYLSAITTTMSQNPTTKSATNTRPRNLASTTSWMPFGIWQPEL